MKTNPSAVRATGSLLAMSLALLASAALAQTPTPAATTTASSPVAKAAARSAKTAATPAAQGNMDLSAPPLSHIYPRTQLQYILAFDPTDADTAEEVSVKSPKYIVPVPVGQFQAIPWALLHPTQAWRIFTPLEQP